LSLDISNNSIGAQKQVKEADCQGGSFNVGDLVQYQGEECPVSATWNDGDIRITLLSGIKALADGIKNNGALSILNMSKNDMQGSGAGKALGDALATNTVLKKLDLSGQPATSIWDARPNIDVAFVKAFAPGLSDNGAMTRLDISKNNIRDTGCKALAEALTGNQVMKELNVASNQLTLKADAKSYNDLDMSGVTALADAIKDMRALTKLDISNNHIGAEQEGGLQRICVASGIELAK
jgi:Ran GTPase-activating protein (RanGAP) involved in mRNA processing and transport